MIALEAMLAGAADVSITIADGWISVCSDVDWLSDVGAGAFSRFIDFEPVSPNGVTAEFLPIVFSRSVVTMARVRRTIIKGTSRGPLTLLSDEWKRVVDFEIESSEVE